MAEEPQDITFVVPRPNEPRLDWDLSKSEIAEEWEHLVVRSSASAAVKRLLAGGTLNDADVIAFGRLNFHAYVDGFSPPVALWDDHPKLNPNLRAYLSTK